MRLVLGWLVIAVALAVVVVETAGRNVTEGIAEDQIRAAGVAGEVEVTIGRSWWQPSIIGVLLFDTLDRVDVRLTDARLYSTQVHEADYVLKDLGLDLSIRERTVRATSLGSGSVRVLIDPSAVAKMVGGKASIQNGRLLLAGSGEPVRIRIVGSNLVLDGAAIAELSGSDSVSLPVVDPQILPCTPKVRIVDRFIELSCAGNRLPGVLASSLGVIASGGPVGPGGPGGETGPGAEWPPGGDELAPPATLELPPPTEDSPTTDAPDSTPPNSEKTTPGAADPNANPKETTTPAGGG
ncbi:MAG: hypothetical protein WBF71_00535 [Microthrixaceae bacterium]